MLRIWVILTIICSGFLSSVTIAEEVNKVDINKLKAES